VNPWWLVLAVLIFVGSLGAQHIHAGGGHLLAAGVFGGLAGLAVVGASVWPRPALVVCAAAVLGYFAAGLANGPIFIALPVAVLVAAQRLRPRALAPALAVAGGLLVAGLALRSAVHDVSWGEGFWQCVAVLAMSTGAAVGGWSVGDRRRSQAERARLVATEERLRMARELHDGVGHGLAVIAMHAGVALHLTDRQEHPNEEIRRLLEAIRDASRDSLDALRAELGRLSPGDTTADRTPARGLADVDVLLDRVRAGGLLIDVHRDDLTDVSDGVGTAAYAIVQEALTNVLRHAGADHVDVRLALRDGRLEVVVADDGRVREEPVREGMGLQGMRARAERLGGTLTAGPGEHGFVVRADLPLGSAR